MHSFWSVIERLISGGGSAGASQPWPKVDDREGRGLTNLRWRCEEIFGSIAEKLCDPQKNASKIKTS